MFRHLRAKVLSSVRQLKIKDSGVIIKLSKHIKINRLKTFESTVILSRKAFRVGKFIQSINSGLIDDKQLRNLRVVSAWAELIGYVGSISLKIRDLKVIGVEMNRIKEEEQELRKLREKKLMKWLSVVQDLADGLMAVSDVSDGKGRFSGPVLMASAGLLSVVISTHKNWLSC
ncbi:hypothetical protein QVD17_25209 [Tagetes erecta]|uniref:Peroxisomal membrane protein 11A n=1 Tax=Tagetes erecta TaxID=13708 RepID=A0AAD8NV71_TARER|nr:hypothetical protein QVD17_25209 [Tagetes erecta]